jgi:hypothetical protein
MAMLGMALSLLGGLAMLVFTIQILIQAFKTSVAWGLGSLIVPFVILVYVAKHWQATKQPFLRSLAAFAVTLVGSAISVFGAVSSAPQ